MCVCVYKTRDSAPLQLTIKIAAYGLVESGELVGLERTVVFVPYFIDLEDGAKNKSRNVSLRNGLGLNQRQQARVTGGGRGAEECLSPHIVQWPATGRPVFWLGSCSARRDIHNSCRGALQRRLVPVQLLALLPALLLLQLVVASVVLLLWQWPLRWAHISLIMGVVGRSATTKQ